MSPNRNSSVPLSYRLVRTLPLLVLVIFATACQTAPSFNILGSFFPVWIFCIITAIFATLAFRVFLIRYRLESEVGPLVIIYPSFATFVACSMWLLFFRS